MKVVSRGDQVVRPSASARMHPKETTCWRRRVADSAAA